MVSRRSVQPEDFYLTRTINDVQVSPDGKSVAWVQGQPDKDSDETQTSIWVAPMDAATAGRRFTWGKQDNSPRWSPDSKHLAFVSNRAGASQVFVVPADGGEANQVTHAPFGASAPAWSPTARQLVYVARFGDYKEAKDRNAREKSAPRVLRDLSYKFDGVGQYDERRTHVFTVDLASGSEVQITNGDWNDQQPSWSPNGRWIAFVSDREPARWQRTQRGDIWLVSPGSPRVRKLTRSLGGASLPAFSPDGRLVAFVGHEHGEAGAARNIRLYVVPTSGREAPHCLTSSLDLSVAGHPLAPNGQTFGWRRDGGSLVFIAGERGTLPLYQVSLDGSRPTKVLGGERAIQSVSTAPDGGFACTVAWPGSLPEAVAVASQGRNRERVLSGANREFRASHRLAQLKRVSHKTDDGLDIESFLMLPPFYRRGRKYPLVLEVHGGPHGVHPGLTPHYWLQFQALAAAGYAVLLPNPRGSTGYGESFTQACVGDWGGKDYDDLMGAVDRLVREGIADPDRLYVSGYSYGGFMTSWIIGHTQRFRAAVIGAPVVDQMSMLGTTDIPLFENYEMGGLPWPVPDAYQTRSPVTYLPMVTTPVLLIHYEGDLRVPVSQSELLFQGLKLLGKEVEFVRYPGGFHGVRTPSQSVDHVARILRWLAGHRPGAMRAGAPQSRVAVNA